MKPDMIQMLAKSVAIAVLAMYVSTASAGQDSQASSDPALAKTQAFVAALNNADLDALVETFAEDATIFLPFSSDPARVTGKERIRGAFDPFLQRVRASGEGPPYLRISPADVHVQHFDGTAVVTFHLGQFPAPTEKEPSTFSRRTVVLRQIGGEWLIVHLHASNMVTAPSGQPPPK